MSVFQKACLFPVTGGIPVRSSAILRRTRPGECHKAFIPLIHATCIIALFVSPV